MKNDLKLYSFAQPEYAMATLADMISNPALKYHLYLPFNTTEDLVREAKGGAERLDSLLKRADRLTLHVLEDFPTAPVGDGMHIIVLPSLLLLGPQQIAEKLKALRKHALSSEHPIYLLTGYEGEDFWNDMYWPHKHIDSMDEQDD